MTHNNYPGVPTHVDGRKRITFQVNDDDAAAIEAIQATSKPYRLTYTEVIRHALRQVAGLQNSR
jgi:hypothetical protein